MTGTVSISIQDFEGLVSDQKSYKEIIRQVSSCAKIESTKDKGWSLIINKTKATRLFAENNYCEALGVKNFEEVILDESEVTRKIFLIDDGDKNYIVARSEEEAKIFFIINWGSELKNEELKVEEITRDIHMPIEDEEDSTSMDIWEMFEKDTIEDIRIPYMINVVTCETVVEVEK